MYIIIYLKLYTHYTHIHTIPCYLNFYYWTNSLKGTDYHQNKIKSLEQRRSDKHCFVVGTLNSLFHSFKF